MDGFEALEQMRNNPKCANVPVIVITSHQDPEMHRRALELGAMAVLTKPFQLQAVGDILAKALAGGEDLGGASSGLKPLGV
jgi:CheY-like chemotaxis protein